MENRQPDEWLKDLPVQTENLAFNSEEMIRCAACERASPPNRLKCLYCGKELDVSESQSQNLKLNLRKLEFWEKGFNLIVLPNQPIPDETKLRESAKLLKIEREVLRKIIEIKKNLPLARVESEKEADILRKYLSEFGLETRILSDESLAIEKPARRLRGIEFFDDKFAMILFNQSEIVEVLKKDLTLIVTGAVFERRIEATEKYSKKGENTILNSTEVSTDETLLDIYSRADSDGYRIWAKGFDFSCLASEKGILAKENLKKLAGKLRQTAPNAAFVDDYLRIREALANVWEVEQKSDSHGLKREGIGKFNLGNVTTINNLAQFTKYSRLQRHFL